MNTGLKRVVMALVVVVLVAASVWLFFQNREERRKETERERAVVPEARTGRSPAGEPMVVLDREAQEQLGLRDTILVLGGATRELRAYGQVVDPTSLVTLDGDLSSAEVVVRASKAEFERARALRQREVLAQATLDAAEARYRTDESRRRQAEQQMAADWGDWISTRPQADRHVLVERIAERRIALARVSLPAGESVGLRVSISRIEVLGHEQSPLRPQRVLDAPSTDPRTPGPSFLLMFAPSGFSVRPGDPVSAFLPGGKSNASGVLIPRDATVRYGGRVWAYVRTGLDQFVRREVPTDRPAMGGWVAGSGFTPGERTVIVGAQALLSEEFKSQIQVGEEGEAEKEREAKGKR